MPGFTLKKIISVVALFVILLSTAVLAQDSKVAIGTEQLKDRAILWLKGNGTNQGLLLPVVSNRSAFTGLNNTDDKGMFVFDLSDNKIYCWNGTAWTQGGVDLNSITSAEIANATIVDVDIANVSAAKITTGTLPVARGGTNITSVVPGAVAYGGTTDFAFTAPGSTGQVLTSNGSSAPTWTDASASTVNGPGPVPAGGIMMWSGLSTEIPIGYVLCDGSTYIDKNGVSRTAPDLRGKFLVGYDPAAVSTPTNVTTGKELNYGTIGNTGGEDVHVLSSAELASHTHGGSVDPGGAHNHSVTVTDGGAHSHTASSSTIGSHNHAGTTEDENQNHTHGFDLSNLSNFLGGARGLASGTASGSTSSGTAGISINHQHSFTTSSNGDHSHTIAVDGIGDHSHSASSGSVGDHSHGFTGSSTGGDISHENRPSYYVIAFIIKKY